MLGLWCWLVLAKMVLVGGMAGAPAQDGSSGAAFTVASVKPTPAVRAGQLRFPTCRGDGSFAVAGAPVLWSLEYAFAQPEYAIAGQPLWLSDFNSSYDMEAKTDGGGDAKTCRTMLQSLFRERFHLVVHHETRLTAVLLLKVSNKGAKLKPGGGVHWNGSVEVNDTGPRWPDGWTMAYLASVLSDRLERPVMDETGLAGTYGITLDSSVREGDGKPDLSTAVREQLGLRLVPGKAPVDFLVIDHIQRPDPN